MVFSRRILLSCLISLVASLSLFGQAKKPTLMVLPSDNWCIQRYFYSSFDNQGTSLKVPNYKQAFQEDTELRMVISKIGEMLTDRGFPIKDAEQELKALEQRSAEDMMAQSNESSASLATSSLDALKNRTRTDIVLQIWWEVKSTSQGKVVSFILEAFDAYTSKQIAASSGSSTPSDNEVVLELLQQAVLANMDDFTRQLQNHFTDLLENGREIIVQIKRWDNWEENLESEFNDKELITIIDDWMYENTVSHRYNLSDYSENFMFFEQVRIPVYDENERPIDARRFTDGLRRYLKDSPYGLTSKLMIRGLGEAILVIGEK